MNLENLSIKSSIIVAYRRKKCALGKSGFINNASLINYSIAFAHINNRIITVLVVLVVVFFP